MAGLKSTYNDKE